MGYDSGGRREVTLRHEAGGTTKREVYVLSTGIWVDWGIGGQYRVMHSRKAQGYRRLVAPADSSGGQWTVSEEDMRDLLAELREIRKPKKHDGKLNI